MGALALHHPTAFASREPHSQAPHAWLRLMASKRPAARPPARSAARSSSRAAERPRDRRASAVTTEQSQSTAEAAVVPRSPPIGLDWGIRLSWRTLAGIATLVGLLLLGIKAVTYTNNLAHSITTLAGAVGKLDGTIGTVTSDVASIKQRMAAYDAIQLTRQTELADMTQRQQRIEQSLADLRAVVAAATAQGAGSNER